MHADYSHAGSDEAHAETARSFPYVEPWIECPGPPTPPIG